jgi:Fur family transcriptional regulator, ferric uptake regulator
MKPDITRFLKDHGLSITESRTKIYQFFLDSAGAISFSDIEKKYHNKIDRATIYRTLQTFIEKGFIHSIPTADNTVLYALCGIGCTGGHHQDNHIHFVCDRCHTTYCLDEIKVPFIPLPKGFSTTQTEVLINGICKACQGK